MCSDLFNTKEEAKRVLDKFKVKTLLGIEI